MLGTLLAKVFGTQNERELKKIRPIVEAINAARAVGLEPDRQPAPGQDRRVPPAAGRRRHARRPAARGLCRRARGRPPRAQHAALRRAAHRRLRAAHRPHRRDEDGRRQDAGRDAAGLPQRAGRPGRPRGHGQRLPGAPRLGVDGQDLPLPRHDGRRHPARSQRPGTPGRVRLRHHLRDQQRVRLRLPARQHEVRPRALRPARAPFRDRGRGRQHPDRRGPDAADHLGTGRGIHRPVLRGRPHHPEAQAGRGDPRRHQGRGSRPARSHRRLHQGREAQDRHAHRKRDGPGRRDAGAPAAARRPVRPGQHAAAPPRQPGAACPHALPPRRGLHDQGRPGRHRRRVHGPPDAGAPVERRAAPGRRGQGAGQDRAREPDARDHHLPELLPQVQEARRA